METFKSASDKTETPKTSSPTRKGKRDSQDAGNKSHAKTPMATGEVPTSGSSRKTTVAGKLGCGDAPREPVAFAQGSSSMGKPGPSGAKAPPRAPQPSTSTSVRGNSAPGKSGPSKAKAPAQAPQPPPSTSKRRGNPSLMAFRERRSAYRLLDRLKLIPEAELSEKDKESRAWANRVLAGRKGTITDPASKRQRSLDEQEPTSSKRPKIGLPPARVVKPTKPFSEVAKDSLIWAVVDRSNPDGAISVDNWRSVRIELLRVFMDVMERNPGPTPCCRDAGWYKGRVKLIACADQRSADLYKLAISSLGEVWPGAKLEAVPKDQIPSRPRARTWLPAEPSDPEKILALIRMCNPTLPTHDWRVALVGDAKGKTRQAIVILNEESLAPLSAAAGVICYGFDSLTLAVYSKDKGVERPDGAVRKNAEDSTEVEAETLVGAEEHPAPSPSTSLEEGSDTLSTSGKLRDLFIRDDLEEDLLLSDTEDAEMTVVEVSPSKRNQAESGAD